MKEGSLLVYTWTKSEMGKKGPFPPPQVSRVVAIVLSERDVHDDGGFWV